MYPNSAGRVIKASLYSLISINAVFQYGLKRTFVVFIIKIEVFWPALRKFQHSYLYIIFPNFHLLLCTKYFGVFFSCNLCLFEISQNILSSFPNCNPGNNCKLTLSMSCINYLANMVVFWQKLGYKCFRKTTVLFLNGKQRCWFELQIWCSKILNWNNLAEY